jgi:hypothetical protein
MRRFLPWLLVWLLAALPALAQNGSPFSGQPAPTSSSGGGPAAAGTLTGTTLASGVTGSSLTSAAGGSFGTGAYAAAGLPLTGGTLSGALNANGGINTTASTGYQINGLTAFSIFGSGQNTIPLGGIGAGASLQAGASFSTFFGWYSGNGYNSNGAGEVSGYGNGSCQNLVNGATHDTCLGVYAMHWATTDQDDTATGGDAMRDTFGITEGSAYGSQSYVAYFGSYSSAYGADSLYGNAAGVTFSGTVGTGHTISLVFTSTGITGSPVTVTYVTQAGDTVYSIGNAFITAIAGTPALVTAGIQSATPGNNGPPGNLAIVWNNTSVLGTTPLTVTGSSTGAEVVTVYGGVSSTAKNNNAFGNYSMWCGQCTAVQFNNGFGNNTLTSMTTAVHNDCFGDSACMNAQNSSYISVLGDSGFKAATTAYDDTGIGGLVGESCTNCRLVTLVGYGAGKTTLTTANDVIIITDGSTCDTNTVNTFMMCGAGGQFLGATLTNTAGSTVVTMQSGLLTLGTASTYGGSLTVEGSTSGAAVLTGGTTGVFTSASNFALSGTVNITGTLQSGGTAGLASKVCTINTANAATGITITFTGGLATATTTC